MRRAKALVGATATATALLVVGPAAAAPAVSEPLAEGLVGPLQVDATNSGVFVAESFRGAITKVRNNGTRIDVVTEQGSINGLAVRRGTIAYTFAGGSEQNPVSKLKLRTPDGDTRTLANLGRFENRRNPDGDQRYGVVGVGQNCSVPPRSRPYKGEVFSNPYAVSKAPNGGWYVTDAGANTVLRVTAGGDINLVSVIEPHRERITRALAEELGLRKCTVGGKYLGEGVPTDVQRAGDRLFVSSLPGVPETTPKGGEGELLRVDLRSGRQVTVAEGFLGATNLAFTPGRVFVAELFGGKVSVVNLRSGAVRTFVERPTPSAVDVHDGTLFLTENVFSGPTGEDPSQGRLVAVTGGALN